MAVIQEHARANDQMASQLENNYFFRRKKKNLGPGVRNHYQSSYEEEGKEITNTKSWRSENPVYLLVDFDLLALGLCSYAAAQRKQTLAQSTQQEFAAPDKRPQH